MNFDWRKRRAVNVSAMDNRLFEGTAKEHLTHYQNYGVPAYMGASQESSLHIHQPTLGFNYSVAPNHGSNMATYNVNDNSQYFQRHGLRYDGRGYIVLVGSDGKVIPSPGGFNQIYGDDVSPAQISSAARGDNMELDQSSLSSMPSSNFKLRHEHLTPYGLQAFIPENYRPQSCPPTHAEIPLLTQMYDCRKEHNKLHDEVPVQMSSSLSYLSLEHLRSLEEKRRLARAQTPSHTNSHSFLQKLLMWYLFYSSKLVGHESKQREFLNHVHLNLCKDRICECEKYNDLVSHFDRCHCTGCNICQPVRQWFYAKKTGSDPMFEPFPSEKITSQPNGYVSRDLHARDYIVQDMSPPPKRMKMDNPAKFDDWSLSAVIHPHSEQRVGILVNEEDSKEKTNQEPLGSNEASKTAVTWNATADNDGGSMRSRKFDGLSGLELSPEVMNSASPNVVAESTGNLGNSLQTTGVVYFDHCNGVLGTDDAISHAEEHNSVDEKTSTVKSDVNFSCPSSNSDSICVLPQVGGLGESHRTFNDDLDLDDINLEKDHAIPLPEEQNLVGEQQETGCVQTSKVKIDATLRCQSIASDGFSVNPQESPIVEEENFKVTSQAEYNSVANPDNQCGRKLDDVKASSVSLIDFFSAEQIREHIRSLKQDIKLNVGPEMCTSKSAHTVGSNTCQLCGLDKIMFTALDMYCASCEARIKHNLTYYWIKDGEDVRHCFCTTCFKNSRRGNIACRGLSFPKAQLCKSNNNEEYGEDWVQCDKCERWQHQICGLYNSDRDKEGTEKYTCPFCRLAEIEVKGHVPVTPASGAHDLPRTKLSDCIEQRLFRSLRQERKERAAVQGKNPEEVPGVSDLKVRVVLSVNKELKVRQKFLDFLHDETYPTEFPYKSKAILLFQKVEGVDVCLFAMYAQEFGSECGNPNKRSVYISYIDSVKYFRPEIKTVENVALRTFVYHEILIGYLDYCKRRGFLNCYIWSCPPSKGDDYILLSHPETQKRPNPTKLVQWYKKMLKKAKNEKIVVGVSNLYDTFFVSSGDSDCKISAARLPYFDGDYWSRAIHDIVQSIEENGDESERQLTNKMTKRTMKSMGHKDLSVDATKDIRVMQKLGQTILPVKDEFFVIHLHFSCTHCGEAILSGSCWSCKQCTKFHLCDRCRELELSSNSGETHTDIHGDKHQLHEMPVNEVAADTDDKDILLDNEFFKDRQSFLEFCEDNNYRFDSPRRAKHSSMMILHHLLASLETAMCSICNEKVVEGWHCEMCSQFHVCHACYQREGDGCHVHQLVELADPRKECEQMQQQKASETEVEPRKKSKHIMLQQYQASELDHLLQHATHCSSTRHNPCSYYPECLSLRQMFYHCSECIRRAPGGCDLCKRVWVLLLMHSTTCKASNCTVPRCLDLKNHKRKMATKSDS